jgi:hypothetical protein
VKQTRFEEFKRKHERSQYVFEKYIYPGVCEMEKEGGAFLWLCFGSVD